MLSGFYLVDMRDGSVRVAAPVGGPIGEGGMASFNWSPDSDELVVVVGGRASRVTVPDLHRTSFPRPKASPMLRGDGGWTECPMVRDVVPSCVTYAADGEQVAVRVIPEELRGRWAGPVDELEGSIWFSLATSAYGNHDGDWTLVRTNGDFDVESQLVLPQGSEIDGVTTALAPTILGLAAINDRLLLAYLAETNEIVRLLRPGSLTAVTGQDFWDVSFARDLVRVS